MSGSGGGGGASGGGPQSSDCAGLIKVTTLNSAVPKVVRTLKAGDRLTVTLDPGGSGRVEARTRQGDLAGSITYNGVSSLKKCLEEKWMYVATVQAVSGGDVSIEIRHGTP